MENKQRDFNTLRKCHNGVHCTMLYSRLCTIQDEYLPLVLSYLSTISLMDNIKTDSVSIDIQIGNELKYVKHPYLHAP